MRPLIIQSTPVPCFLAHTPKHLSKHTIIEHPQAVFLPQYERQSFKPIQNNMRSYIHISQSSYFWIAKLDDRRFWTEW